MYMDTVVWNNQKKIVNSAVCIQLNVLWVVSAAPHMYISTVWKFDMPNGMKLISIVVRSFSILWKYCTLDLQVILHLIHLKCQKTTIQMRLFLINLFTKINSFFCVFEVMMTKIVIIMNEEFCKFSVEKIFLWKHKTVNVHFSTTFISVCTEIYCNLAI